MSDFSCLAGHEMTKQIDGILCQHSDRDERKRPQERTRHGSERNMCVFSKRRPPGHTKFRAPPMSCVACMIPQLLGIPWRIGYRYLIFHVVVVDVLLCVVFRWHFLVCAVLRHLKCSGISRSRWHAHFSLCMCSYRGYLFCVMRYESTSITWRHWFLRVQHILQSTTRHLLAQMQWYLGGVL